MNSGAAHSSKARFGACLLACTILCLTLLGFARAQESSLSVSVTPPLFQLTIGPGETWSSSIKVVNNNAYDLSYYANVVDFEAKGEDGKSQFVPLVEEDDVGERHTFSLASWISVPAAPVFIRQGTSGEIPFTVRVPENAEPGGHYAAILVGTQPQGAGVSGPYVKVASFVSTLIFARIKGDIHESGRIREFRTEKRLYQSPEADFVLRFENTGNTHLQPQGDIIIYNMWGKERGRVQVNQNTNFGNVLPQSTRRFEFTWSAEHDPFDIGRYSAVVTLAYGDEAKQNIYGTTYFWVVPIVPVALTLGGFFTFVFVIILFIRSYIRRALVIERARLPHHDSPSIEMPAPSTFSALIEPFREGVVDMRSMAMRRAPAEPAAEAPHKTGGRTHRYRITFTQFLRKYQYFFLFVLVLVLGGTSGWWYVSHALAPQKNYQITQVTSDDSPSSRDSE
jgi:hypothetical protein